MSSSGKKIALFLLSNMIPLFLFITPFIVIAASIMVPILAISEFFASFGNKSIDSKDNIIVEIIDDYLENSSKEITNEFKIYVDQLEDKKFVYVVMPIWLGGIEEPSEELMNKIVELANENTTDNKLDLESYVDALFKVDELENMRKASASIVIEYFKKYDSMLNTEILDSLSKEWLEQFKDFEFIYPFKIKGDVTSEVGGRTYWSDIKQGYVTDNHTGIDIAFPYPNNCGVPIYAVQDGKVTKNERTNDNGGANWGEVEFNNVEVWYLHMETPFPYDVGTEIKKGDYIGKVGNTGNSSGCHLHLEIHVNGTVVNPRGFIDFNNPILPDE